MRGLNASALAFQRFGKGDVDIMAEDKPGEFKKPLEKMTVKELKEVALEIPEITGVHGMNKSDLVKTLAKDMDLAMRKSEEIVDMVFKTMSDALIRGDRIEIRGFGSFMVKDYKGYVGRNPKTGEKILVKSKHLPFFKTGKELKERMNETSA